MTEGNPWETGRTQSERWAGYFQSGYLPEDPSTHVLRNKLDGVRTADQLAYIEGTITVGRAMILKEDPIRPATFDLRHLRAIHHALFQDVYPWAGEIRTVGMSKSGVQFTPTERIADTVDAVGRFLASNDHFRGGDKTDVVSALSVGYGIVNAAHPFREGNGRTQRIFWDEFAREAGHYIDWQQIRGRQNDVASHKARTGDMDALPAMFAKVVHRLEDRGSVIAGIELRRATLQGLAARRGPDATGRLAAASASLPYEPPSQRGGRPGIRP